MTEPFAEDAHWMEEALRRAEAAAAEDEVPVGAVVVKDGRVVGEGQNRREGANDPVSHAEIEAIRQAARALGSWRLTGCVLFVTLEPCPMCLGACQQARLDRVVYGVPDPKGGALSLGYRFHEDVRTNHRFPASCLGTPGCGTLLSEFFQRKRAKAPN